MLVQNFGAGDILYVTNSTSGSVFGLGYVHIKDHQEKALLVNKLNEPATITVDGATGGSLLVCDVDTGFAAPTRRKLTSDAIKLGGWAVAIVDMPHHTKT